MASSSLREKLQTLAEMPGQPSCQRTQLLDEITDASLTEFQNTGDVDHLQRAVTLGKEAVESTHYHNDSVRVRYLGNLGLALQMRNHSTGSLNDINEAIAVFQNAIQLCDPGNTDDMFLLAANLGTTFLSRFLCTGSVQDLQDSIARTETALKTVPPEHRGYLGGLCTIAEALHERFELLGSMHDINRCLTIYDDIYKSMPIDHSYYLTAATKYGDALLTKSRRTPEIEILDRTIGMLQLVVECSRQTDSNRAGYLDRLGAAFELRSTFLLEGLSLNKYIPDGESTETADELEQQCHERMSRAEADIEQSITYLRESAELILENSPAKSTSLNTLGVSLTKRFAHTRSIIDINDAIAAFEGAVRSTPDSHPSKGIYLTCLGTALEKRSEHSMSRDDLRRASEVYALTAGLDSAPPKQRIFTARLAVKLLEASDIHSAYNLLRTSVELLPSTSPHGIDYRDQQNALSFHGGLASDSAALALECGKRPADAASLLDAGRGIILGRSIDIHSDVKGLPEEVAERYNAARALLDRPFPPEGMPTDRGRALQDEANIEIRHRAALAFGQLTKEIRELEGFHEFGLPLSPQKLMEEAIYGPVVIINVNSRRSDAFLVTDSAIHNQPLPNLKPSEVERQVELFRAALKVIDHPQKGDHADQNLSKAQRQFFGTLEWLWDTVAKPILVKLGFANPPSQSSIWPKVWWCPTGILSTLPIHAAGYHNTDSTNRSESVMDRVVSVYTSTIRSLKYARESLRPLSSHNVLVACMPETPNQKRLPRAREEAAFVESCFLDRKAGSVNFVDCPAIESIEKELPHSTIVHFSCHAMSAEDPSLSGVILVNGNLTVSKISQMNLRGGALAYLSACNTAYSQPDTDLQDESLVLTSAFQVAGFSHVVGTLWTAEDSIATLVAKSFYEELKTDTANSANALHEAVRKQRKEHGKEPWLWAQFICVGA